MNERDKILKLAEKFRACGKILTAIGDETRQHLMVEMMKMDGCNGARVGVNLQSEPISPDLRYPTICKSLRCRDSESPKRSYKKFLLF